MTRKGSRQNCPYPASSASLYVLHTPATSLPWIKTNLPLWSPLATLPYGVHRRKFSRKTFCAHDSPVAATGCFEAMICPQKQTSPQTFSLHAGDV